MPLPTFVIAGERRCGTTSLSKWLEIHPEIYLHPRLDMAYFIDDAIRGRREWLEGEVDLGLWENTHSVEAYARIFDDGDGFKAIGEKSADYFFWRPAHARLARYLPEARFVVILRNPIDRAWSHYWNEVGKRRETLSFAEALAAEEVRCRHSAYARDHLSYRSRGFYDETLADFRQQFSEERLFIVILEEITVQPEETLRELYRFLSVDPELGLERAGEHHNANWTTVRRDWVDRPILRDVEAIYVRLMRRFLPRLVRSFRKGRELRKYAEFLTRRPAAEETMSPEVRARLQSVYAPHVERLEQMLGRSLAVWKE